MAYRPEIMKVPFDLSGPNTLEPDESASKRLQDYLAAGPNRENRLKIMNDCLFEIVRGPDETSLNVVGFLFGSAHVQIRQKLVACARSKGEPI